MLSPWLMILPTWKPNKAAIDVFQVPWITSIDGFDRSGKPLFCNGRRFWGRWVFPFCNILRAKLGTDAFWTGGYWLGPDNETSSAPQPVERKKREQPWGSVMPLISWKCLFHPLVNYKCYIESLGKQQLTSTAASFYIFFLNKHHTEKGRPHLTIHSLSSQNSCEEVGLTSKIATFPLSLLERLDR